MTTLHTLSVYASHFQFYVMDADAQGDTADPAFWTDAAFDSRLAVQPGVVGIATNSYCDVPVTVELLDSEPDVSLDDWDHVAEASLSLSAGRLEIRTGAGDEADLSLRLAPGRVRLRVSFAGLDQGPDDGQYNGDSYFIQIWPSETDIRIVLKKFGAGRSLP
jgi:hypothetical protein